MELKTAIGLLDQVSFVSAKPQTWADLGSGDGLFTRALATLLPTNSSILAFDRNEAALKSIRWESTSVSLKIQVGDFSEMNLIPNLDGILMANALHYIQHQNIFLEQLKSLLISSGQILLVEYETKKVNPWVPYPIDFTTLQKIGMHAGFSSIRKLKEIPSAYQGSMYSAVLRIT